MELDDKTKQQIYEIVRDKELGRISKTHRILSLFPDLPEISCEKIMDLVTKNTPPISTTTKIIEIIEKS